MHGNTNARAADAPGCLLSSGDELQQTEFTRGAKNLLNYEIHYCLLLIVAVLVPRQY
jgi:hypothetical protein